MKTIIEKFAEKHNKITKQYADHFTIYHLREDQNGIISDTMCNKKNIKHWRKYKLVNFIRGSIFDLSKGEITIVGRKCRRCLTFLA